MSDLTNMKPHAFLDKSIVVRVKSRTLNKKHALAEIAQLVEHATENRGVPSPILGLGTPVRGLTVFAGVVQW
jgi:hypothetical protein